VSLGVGLTNACNLACSHCYRAEGTQALDAAELLAAIYLLPVRSVNFGTGENALHPDFGTVIDELARRGIRITMTTNGYSAQVLSDARLQLFAEVEFSIDYPTPADHDRARGPGNWLLIEEQMARCTRLGIRTTVLSVMMSTNFAQLPAVAAVAGARGALLRVNAFQAVTTADCALSYAQFWQGYRDLLAVADLETCGEPIVRAMLGIARSPGAGCGSDTLRITPRGALVACVYQSDGELRLSDLRQSGAEVLDDSRLGRDSGRPASCHDCPQLPTCGGGCASRRALAGRLGEPDPYCPLQPGRPPHGLMLQNAKSGEVLAKASSACTTVFRYRTDPHRSAPRRLGGKSATPSIP
jgi:radical SAM protein with 4Fe4S-binding SPASM domain